MAVIATDLGGTKLAGAIFAERGGPVARRVVPLGRRRGRAVGALIRQQVRTLLRVARAKGLEVTAVGVSVPGIARGQTGTVWAPNLPGWEDYPLREELEREVQHHAPLVPAARSAARQKTAERRRPATPIRVLIDSDRACYILGEAWRGAAKGCRNAIFLAVGTGIGAGILVDGEVLRGAHDIAGAIGWLALDRPFRPEYVGCGCFEHHASGEGLAKVARQILARQSQRSKALTLQRLSAPTARDIFAAHRRGDPVARQVLSQAVEYWGMAVANLVSLYNPEKIIFGGGVFGPATQFLGDIYAEAKQWAQPVAIQQVRLQPSKLGSDAGLYGAAYLALQAAKPETPHAPQPPSP